MSTVTSAADWLRAGGIGVGAWAVLAVLVKTAADATGPACPTRPQPEAPALEVPPCPAYPPSTGRHAGPADLDETRLLAAPVSLRKGHLAWT